MPNTPWTDLVLCTPADVKGRARNAETLLQIDRENESIDDKIQQKIDLSKDWIRQDLIRDLKKRIPEVVNSWLTYKRFQINESMQNIRRDMGQISDAAGLPTVGVIGFDGTIFDLFFFLTQFPQIHPRTYSNYGVPTNGTQGTLAGSAFTGDILVDTFGWKLYINKGTLVSPQWRAEFTANDAINNLTNATVELKHVAVNAALWAMAQDGMLVLRPEYDTNPFMLDQEALWRKRYRESFADALPLLDVNIDGSGVVSDYERGLMTNEIAIIG